MPIDFPTRKNADRVATPPTAPAADDTMQLQTAALGDRVAYLGNLAGIAPVAVANDQALANIGGAWASYSLTAAGRALSGVAGTANTFPYFSAANVATLASVTATGLSVLSAANQAAARTAIQAVGTVGSESVTGVKTFSSEIRISNVAPGFWLDESDGTMGMFAVLDNGVLQLQVRGAGFGPYVDQIMQIALDRSSTAFAGTTVRPRVDNAQSLGSSTFRWTTVFATNATISTSDARLKTEPRQLREAEFKAFSAVCRLPPVWRWLSRVHGDENCEPEGRSARKHFGPTVQAAMQVFADNGLDAFENAPFCYDEWEAQEEQWHEWGAKDAVLDDDGNVLEPAVEAGRELIQPAREAGNRYSFRKEELLCGMVSALARENDEQAAKIEAQRSLLDDLLARVAALEAKG